MAGLFIRVLDKHGVIFLLTPTGLLMEAHGVSRGNRMGVGISPVRGGRTAVSFAPLGSVVPMTRVPTNSSRPYGALVSFSSASAIPQFS
jgi:hypothetical protein